MKNNHYQILLVDDDPQVARLVKNWLVRDLSEMADVLCVTNPDEAFGRIRDETVELLITDLNMPSFNGYHLLKELKSIRPTSQVLVLTGQSSENAFHSALEMGADDYLLKPFQRQTLIDCVQRLLDRMHRWRTELGFDLVTHDNGSTTGDRNLMS